MTIAARAALFSEVSCGSSSRGRGKLVRARKAAE
jgi:hypothetical protein